MYYRVSGLSFAPWTKIQLSPNICNVTYIICHVSNICYSSVARFKSFKMCVLNAIFVVAVVEIRFLSSLHFCMFCLLVCSVVR